MVSESNNAITMKNETLKQRKERKAIWIARTTSHYDTPEIRREASEMFEKANPLPVPYSSVLHVINLMK